MQRKRAQATAEAKVRSQSKSAEIVELLRRPEGQRLTT